MKQYHRLPRNTTSGLEGFARDRTSIIIDTSGSQRRTVTMLEDHGGRVTKSFFRAKNSEPGRNKGGEK